MGVGTVSRVLNGVDTVSLITRKRVQAVIRHILCLLKTPLELKSLMLSAPVATLADSMRDLIFLLFAFFRSWFQSRLQMQAEIVVLGN